MLLNLHCAAFSLSSLQVSVWPLAQAPDRKIQSTCHLPHTWDSSRSRSTGERGSGERRGDRRGEGGDSSGVRRGFSVPSSSLSCSRVSPRGSSAVVSSSPGLSLILDGPGGGGGRSGVAGSGGGGGGGGPGAGAVLRRGSGGGRGEEVRDKGRGEQVRERGSGEQVRDGGVGVEGREMEGGGERLLRSPHCSLFSLLLMAEGTCVFAGPCRSAVTVAEEAGGTSSVGDLEGAGLAFLPSAGGSTVLGVGGLLAPADACWP